MIGSLFYLNWPTLFTQMIFTLSIMAATYRLEKYIDYPHNDIDYHRSIGYDACKAKCNARRDCVAFVLATAPGQTTWFPTECWLKGRLLNRVGNNRRLTNVKY